MRSDRFSPQWESNRKKPAAGLTAIRSNRSAKPTDALTCLHRTAHSRNSSCCCCARSHVRHRRRHAADAAVTPDIGAETSSRRVRLPNSLSAQYFVSIPRRCNETTRHKLHIVSPWPWRVPILELSRIEKKMISCENCLKPVWEQVILTIFYTVTPRLNCFVSAWCRCIPQQQ